MYIHICVHLHTHVYVYTYIYTHTHTHTHTPHTRTHTHNDTLLESTGIGGCKCFAGYYMSGGACVMCPEAKTSKAGSTSADECDTLCGLPDSANAGQHAEKTKKAAFDVAEALDAMRAGSDAYVSACKAETDALEKMSAELTYEPPATLSKEAIAGYASDVTNLQEDANLLNKYVPIVRTSGALQVASTTSYLAQGDKLKDAVVKLQEAFQDQMTTEHHIKEALTRCQPTVACIPSPCGEVEPSNPCEPWVRHSVPPSPVLNPVGEECGMGAQRDGGRAAGA